MQVHKIPGIPGYSLNKLGEVFNDRNSPVSVLLGKDGHPTVSLKMPWWKNKHHQVARLVLMTFDPRENTDELSVSYLDDDITNVAADNLAWEYTWFFPDVLPGITCPAETFVPITGFSDYGVTISGKVINLKTKHLVNGHAHSNGRRIITIHDNFGILRTVRVHRLVASMFLRHPKDTNHLVVNHKDGNPGNNCVENLEWVTSSENNKHAFRTGLRPAKAIMSKNLDTQEILTHPTLTDCARYIGVTPNYLHVYISATRVTKFATVKQKFQVKLATDLTPWPTEKVKPNTKLTNIGNIQIFNISTKRVETLSSILAVNKKYNIPKTTVGNLLAKEIPIPYGNIMIRKESDEKWPNYPREIVFVFNQMRNKSKPIKVIDTITGEPTFWAGIKYWCKQNTDTDPAVVCRSVNATGKFKHYLFDFINLLDYA